MAKVAMGFTVSLELNPDEYQLLEAALMRQLRGDDVAKARALHERISNERKELLKSLVAACPAPEADGIPGIV